MRDIVVGILATLFTLMIIGAILGLPVMLLWNWLMPDIFGLCTIDFWHALGLSLLSLCLFGGGHIPTAKKKK